MSLKRIRLFSLHVPYGLCESRLLSPSGRAASYAFLLKPVKKEAWQRPITFLVPLKSTKSNLRNYVLALGKKIIRALFPMSFYLGKGKYFDGIWAKCSVLIRTIRP